MAEQILGLFCDPPIVIARLGGSTTPLDCCVWEEPPNPRSDGATVLVPDWSLNVLPDGSVEPLKPDAIRFRDGPLIRPVCPFIEIGPVWASREATHPPGVTRRWRRRSWRPPASIRLRFASRSTHAMPRRRDGGVIQT